MENHKPNNINRNIIRIDTVFRSKGTQCAAWLYLPEGIRRPPVVILAHGFGGERTFRLPAYAEHFTTNGMACFVFDYRTFGDSDGEPRNYINPARHLEDWQAAINYIRCLDSVDGTRIALWGTSFSGGHVIVTAARTQGISAIVAQIPFVDGRSSSRSLRYKIQAVYHGLWDLLSSIILKHRHYVPMVSDPDTFAMLNTSDALEGAKKLLPPGMAPGRRKCPAVIGLISSFYRPIKVAHNVKCPSLIIYAEKDTLISQDVIKKTAQGMKQVTLIGLPIKHFDIYEGEAFDKVVALEADFLKKYLAVNPAEIKANEIV